MAQGGISFTDLAGREIHLDKPAQKVILGEGRYLPTLAIFDRNNPAKRVVGMMGEFEKYDPASYSQYVERFPEIASIPRIGDSSSASFSLEQALSVSPDVAFFGLSSGHGPSDKDRSVIDTLEAAGVPVVILDFRIDPLVNTPKSIEILGKVLGRENEAEEFLSFYQKQLAVVENGLDGDILKPSVFMESRVGLGTECCEAMGRRMMGRFISAAGGVNAFGEKIPGTHGSISREYLLVNEPDVYIGTAIGSSQTHERFPQFISLGAKTNVETAKASLRSNLERVELRDLRAVKDKKAYAIWHHFYNSPMNVVAVQVLAKWLHPQRFSKLSPGRVLEEYFERFQPFPVDGVYWVEAQ